MQVLRSRQQSLELPRLTNVMTYLTKKIDRNSDF